ncbi:hypothetical protein EYF80_034419 [Liparis tanakae]|uniref:Uncharacterized protein n=1 Tax=Liparis tanakae TaxID=230148 RepID=A0A4Z2GPF8_9TELE|nr:hypothetical protein EYF80_034419 [Liparis tanakae]
MPGGVVPVVVAQAQIKRSKVSFPPGEPKLPSTLDPSQDSTALSTDGRAPNARWLDSGATVTRGSSTPSWCTGGSPHLSASPPLLSEEMMMGSKGSSVPEMVMPSGPPYRCSSTLHEFFTLLKDLNGFLHRAALHPDVIDGQQLVPQLQGGHRQKPQPTDISITTWTVTGRLEGSEQS